MTRNQRKHKLREAQRRQKAMRVARNRKPVEAEYVAPAPIAAAAPVNPVVKSERLFCWRPRMVEDYYWTPERKKFKWLCRATRVTKKDGSVKWWTKWREVKPLGPGEWE